MHLRDATGTFENVNLLISSSTLPGTCVTNIFVTLSMPGAAAAAAALASAATAVTLTAQPTFLPLPSPTPNTAWPASIPLVLGYPGATVVNGASATGIGTLELNVRDSLMTVVDFYRTTITTYAGTVPQEHSSPEGTVLSWRRTQDTGTVLLTTLSSGAVDIKILVSK